MEARPPCETVTLANASMGRDVGPRRRAASSTAASCRALVVRFASTAEVVGGRRLREHHADASTGTSAAETVSALLTTLDFAGWATTPRLCLRSGLLAAAGASKIARRGDGR